MRNNVLYLVFILLSLITIGSCQSSGQIEQAQFYINGKLVYEQHCQNCHGSKGEGLGMLIPPLTDTGFITDNLQDIAGYIKYGVSGKMIIHGKVYNGEMPAETHLSSIEITYIINYIGNSFGNEIGFYPLERIESDLNTYSKQ